MSERTPEITLGMACYDDFDGVFFTLEHLRWSHPLRRLRAEIVVVDNHPDGPQAEAIKHYISSIVEVPARYIPMPAPVGTSPPRDRVIQEAQGRVVVCMDSHVMIRPEALDALIEYFESHPHPVLVSGVLVTYDRKGKLTHFDPVWRAGMWGIWGSDDRGYCVEAPAFEIPAQGLGLFACRKAEWPGFNPLSRGFGGEECYIHEKFRLRGGKCVCLPALQFVHRFHDQKYPTAYPNLWEDRIRNYCLEFIEMGWDLAPVREHFVGEKIISADAFDTIAASARSDWEAFQKQAPTTPAPRGCGCGGKGVARFRTLEEWVAYERQAGVDPAWVIDRITHWASGAREIRHYGGNPTTVAAVLAANPQGYMVVAANPGAWLSQARTVSTARIGAISGSSDRVRIPGGEIAIIDCRAIQDASNPEPIYRLTRDSREARRIIIVGNEASAAESEPLGRAAIRRFVREFPEWSVVEYRTEPPGLAVLSRDPSDKPPLPPTLRQIANFARAVAEHVVSGAGMVSRELLEARLNTCALCDKRITDAEGRERCSVCGCYLVGGVAGAGGKAEWLDQDCPLGKWPAPQSQAEAFEKVSVP